MLLTPHPALLKSYDTPSSLSLSLTHIRAHIGVDENLQDFERANVAVAGTTSERQGCGDCGFRRGWKKYTGQIIFQP